MKYEIENTGYHKATNIICIALLIGVFSFLLLSWDRIPVEIPLHYNAAGEINRWGGKQILWLYPVIAGAIYAGITILERFPQIWNTGVTVTDKNRSGVYLELKNLIVTVKLVVVLTFVFLAVHSARAAPLPAWFLPAELILIFGSIAFFLTRVFRESKAGEK